MLIAKVVEDPMLQKFQLTLDAEMKRLASKGKGVKKQAQPITCEEEERLWQLGLLGDHSAQALVDTMVFQMGLYFALRSGQEHRRLRYHPSQVTLFEPPGGRAYLVYQEDVSKTNQGGIQNMKKVPKEVVHYSNQSNPSRCLERFYKSTFVMVHQAGILLNFIKGIKRRNLVFKNSSRP